MESSSTLAQALGELKQKVNLSASQLASAGLVDWSLFSKVMRSEENRTLSAEQIETMIDDLQEQQLLIDEEGKEWRELLHAAALTDKTMSMIISRRNPDVSDEILEDVSRKLLETFRGIWRQSEGQVGVFMIMTRSLFERRDSKSESKETTELPAPIVDVHFPAFGKLTQEQPRFISDYNRTISGDVCDKLTKEPISMAFVSCHRTFSYFHPRSSGWTLTNAFGRYRLPTMIHDTDGYEIKVSAVGYDTKLLSFGGVELLTGRSSREGFSVSHIELSQISIAPLWKRLLKRRK